MTSATRRSSQPRTPQGKVAKWFDDRLNVAGPTRKQLNKVFPDNWSFMMGEIALYSFIILLLSGTYLSFFFDPSMTEVHYDGSYSLLRGVEMSRAYDSTLAISFDVRGGLLMRQIHHWAALLFIAAVCAHLLRLYFTGGVCQPPRLNWLILGCFLGLGKGAGRARTNPPGHPASRGGS